MNKILASLLVSATVALPAAARPAPFEFRDGDRVVFIGDTLIEREQTYGHVETRLTARFADRHLTFRNIGWSADSVLGRSRASFDWIKGEEEVFRQFREQIAAVKPTVVVLGYGMADSFDGEAGVGKFKENLNRLMDSIQKIGNNQVRFVLLSPIRHEQLGAPLPDPARHNAQLELYASAIESVAAARQARFIDLFHEMPISDKKRARETLTDNGIHLNDLGYRRLADVIEEGLGYKAVDIARGSTAGAAERLRQEILKKNELFFHRWRPENQTYLFGFRKYEQGQNAREIPMFDPLVDAEEKEIAALADIRKPTHVSLKPVPVKTERKQAPEQPLPQFELDPNVEISLFASSPDLAKPIHMNFDPQGRLWVASSSVYPQIQPGQSADDKIIILEDTNHDGRADKSTVFAEGLLIPTGVEPGDGGAYVAQSTELLHFKDVNGDGRADVKKIVLSGFGTEDTHHILHSLKWGYDGQLYMNQSIYIHTHTETPNGVVHLNSGGILYLRPGKMEMGVLLKGLINSWGHDFDQYGQSFATDGAGGAGINYVMPGAMYVTYEGARRILGSVSPGNYPKFCSLEIIASEQFPETWQGNMITCDFRAHRVVRFSIAENKSAYLTTEQPDLIRTTDVSFRPVDVKLGPDGALYIADWSNPIIQHGEVDFRDPRRDHEHGRIWRVTYKGRPLVQTPDLVKASNPTLLDLLLSRNAFQRDKARRVLIERGEKIAKDLESWASRQTGELARLNALWMYEALDKVQPALLTELLNARDAHVRAAATRVLSFWQSRIEKPIDLLAARIQDEHPRVRLEALRALSRVPTARAAELALSVLNKPMDDFLDYGAWLTINDLAQPWLEAVRNGTWKTDGRENQLAFALNALEPQLASQALAQVLTGRTISAGGDGPWIELIGKAGGSAELKRLWDQLVSGGFSDAAAARAVAALSEAGRVRGARPSGDLSALVGLLGKGNESLRLSAIRLAGAWKLGTAVKPLLEAASTTENETARRAAFESLREIGGGAVVAGLRPLTEKDHSASVRQQAAVALAAIDPSRSMPQVVQVLVDASTEAEALSLWRSILSAKGASASLVKSLPAQIPKIVASSGFRAAREGGRNEPELILALSRAGNLDAENASLTPEEIQQLANLAKEKGNAIHGEAIYRRAELGCVSCHSIGGAGGKVGPDLTSIGASAQVDYLVESVLFPSRKIKEGYHAISIETKDGQEYAGVLVRETTDQLFIRSAANQEVAISKNNIASRNVSTGSLMPSGLIDALSGQERIDLFRFLSELGKPGPFDASKGNVARLWRIYTTSIAFEQDPDAVNNLKFGKIGPVRGTGFWLKDWETVLGTVDGRLLKEYVESKIEQYKVHMVNAYASARFQVSDKGPVKFKLSGVGQIPLWVDGKPVQANDEFTVDLAQGPHLMVFQLNPKSIPASLRVEATNATFLLE